jgi:hypothetical protein
MTVIDTGEPTERLLEQMELITQEAISSQHDDHCFTGDTLVVVNDEVMRFDEIPETGYVRGYDGRNVRYVNGGVKHRCSSIYDIKLSNGIIIQTTDYHEFLIEEDGVYSWCKAKHLQGKNICQVKYLTEESIALAQIDTITKHQKMEKAEPVCTEMYGNTTTERYQKDTSCITKITTDQTMISQILSLWKQVRINHTTLKSGLQKIKRKSKQILTALGILQKSGIEAQRVESGIDNTLESHLRKLGLKIKQQLVQFVKKSLTQQKKMLNTAHIDASQKRDTIAELITKRENALCAKQNSQQTNTHLLSVVVESVELNMDMLNEKVYCLEVPDDACFSLADGTVVANCDSLSQVIQMVPTYYGSSDVDYEDSYEDDNYSIFN